MTKALYVGSFDPITNGHLDIIKRAAKIFDELTVVVAINTNKSALFTPQERVNLITQVTRELENVACKSVTGLTAETFTQEKADVLVRGVRNGEDLNFEIQVAGMNQYLNQEVETVFIPANSKWEFTSSSLIKEVVKMGGSIKGLVPETVEVLLKSRLK
ncbi:pantetheine-phosphate adenylyltransferase [Pediococcus pentosaceus]|jgi:pantetheine-phosphate adenylyltransferase|uniref:Phosphopantetheine adenylyltransferase n=1 Tax=Pediococcus pentosaceus TaxID=1255 RepID=A0A6L5A4L5_PEDPE|nr:pantetheine-phosphate adenylyltransferase [Pediococcus pentosaceus]KAF0349370.1 pantetheine-phosphate adenylyltransferase [Pediococcus pentosaceus]KAF0415243.1 pantetheine-phosphate adenylyltransferase [Pediococcus pentosaceus]KAF0501699.1 pantetheine-phosphate adenylyltransferase [Pediococcus pentosaceus]MBF7105370.1 pantetheine-phosphate adenylyltransferase [Pediococcus pentosaceus]MBF7109658.1 pantetheine-phosphate adenylyltransferase [Pediococcus pentosaceus]